MQTINKAEEDKERKTKEIVGENAKTLFQYDAEMLYALNKHNRK